MLSRLFHSPGSPSSGGSSVLLSALRLASVCVKLSISLLAVLIPACAPSSLAFRMMCSACKLDKRGLEWSRP